MEKKLLNNMLIKVSLILSMLAVVVIILLSITAKEYQNVLKNYQKTITEREEREEVALKIGFRSGVTQLGARVSSESFDQYPPEMLKNIPKENIIEFRFKDGKTGCILYQH